MAASKEHLKEINKDYKLKRTDEVTSAGNRVYLNTKTGEKHSEIVITIEYPEGSGNWVNVPSLINGKVYTTKGVIRMLDTGRVRPNSSHINENDAIEAAVYRSNNLQSNTGETLKPDNELADFDPVRQAFIDENVNAFASTFPTREENPNGLFRVPTELEERLNQQILGTDTASMQKTVANNNNLRQLAAIMDRAEAEKDDSNNNVNLVRSQTERITGQENQGELDAEAASKRASLERMYQIMDRAQNEKDDSYFYNPDNPDLNTPWKNWNAKYRMEDILRGTGLKGAENPTMNRYTQTPVSAADQAMFDKAKEERRLLHMGKAMSSYGPRSTPPINTGKRVRKELLPPMPLGNAPAMDDTADIEAGMKTKYTFSEGPSTRGRKRKKPIFSFNMSPDEKMKDNRSLKGLTPTYGEMPGFKKAENGNYWSADENSEFWKTDAGYEKAMETWGASGNPLPTFVKRPARKELDVQAIKNFFKPNR